MPNHIQNEVIFDGVDAAQVAKIRELLRGEEGREIDFATLRLAGLGEFRAHEGVSRYRVGLVHQELVDQVERLSGRDHRRRRSADPAVPDGTIVWKDRHD